MENKQLSRLLVEIYDELCDYLPDDVMTGMSEKHEQLLNRIIGAIKWLDGECCRDFEDFMDEHKLQFVSAPVGDGSLFAKVNNKVIDVSWAKDDWKMLKDIVEKHSERVWTVTDYGSVNADGEHVFNVCQRIHIVNRQYYLVLSGGVKTDEVFYL